MRTILKTYNQLTEGFSPLQKVFITFVFTFMVVCLVGVLFNIIINFSAVQNADFGVIN